MGRCGCGALVEYDADAVAAGQDQWAQCDACGKWREVDGAQLAAIEACFLGRCDVRCALAACALAFPCRDARLCTLCGMSIEVHLHIRYFKAGASNYSPLLPMQTAFSTHVPTKV